MSSAISLFEGIIIFIVSLFVAIILAIALGTTTDYMIVVFNNAGLFDVSDAWDSRGQIVLLNNLLHVIFYTIAIMGLITMILSAIRRQEYDVVRPAGGRRW